MTKEANTDLQSPEIDPEQLETARQYLSPQQFGRFVTELRSHENAEAYFFQIKPTNEGVEMECGIMTDRVLFDITVSPLETRRFFVRLDSINMIYTAENNKGATAHIYTSSPSPVTYTSESERATRDLLLFTNSIANKIIQEKARE